jgi:hypothetical protein
MALRQQRNNTIVLMKLLQCAGVAMMSVMWRGDR